MITKQPATSILGNTGGVQILIGGYPAYISGGSNVTLSGHSDSNAYTLAIHGAAGGTGGGGVALAAGSQTATVGSVILSNSNGISFGMSGSTRVTASYTVPSVTEFLTTAQPPGAYLTTARASNDAVGLNTAATQVTWTVNSSGISLNAGAYLTTAQPPGAYLTTARLSNDAVGLNTAATNVTWTVNSSGVSLNAAGYAGTTTAATNASLTLDSGGLRISVAAPGGGAAQTISAGTTAIAANPVYLRDSNGVSFGFGAGANSTQITATVRTDYQSAGAYLTTARASNDGLGTLTAVSGNLLMTGATSGLSLDARGLLGTNTAGTNMTWTANSAGVSIDAAGYAGTGTSATNASVTLNSNGLAISVAAPGGGAAQTVSTYIPWREAAGGANTGVTNSFGLNTSTSGTLSIFPVPVEVNVAAGFFRVYLSQAFLTVSTGSGRQTGGICLALYKNDTGTNNTRLTYIASTALGWSFTGNNSSYTLNIPTTTFTNGFSTGATNSAGSNLSSIFTGNKAVDFPIGSNLTPGQYFLGLMQTCSTSSLNGGLSHSVWGWNAGMTLNSIGAFGRLSTAATRITTDPLLDPHHFEMHGSYTVAGLTGPPASIARSLVTLGANSNIPYMKIWSS